MGNCWIDVLGSHAWCFPSSHPAASRAIQIPIQRVNEIVRRKRGITPETAWLLAKAFGTSPRFWMNLQSNYDLAVQRPSKKLEALERIAV